MPRDSYLQQLDRLKADVVVMSQLADRAVGEGFRAFSAIVPEPVAEVRKIDKQLYHTRIELETRSLDILALQTPVARDLRTVAVSLNVVNHLDRIGRYALDIAENADRIQGLKHFKRLVTLPRMEELGRTMVRRAMEAYLKQDTGPTQEVFRDEDIVDALYEEVFREVLTYMQEDPAKIHLGLRYIFVGRYLERIADHAVAIGEGVVYLVTGQRIIHE